VSPPADVHSYQQLKRFFEFYVERFFVSPDSLPPEHRPIASLALLEQKSAASARAGLRMAINDIIEMSRRLGRDDVAALDAELASLGILTLSEVRRQHGKQFARIMKRGRIANEAEYYLAQNIINDPTPKPVEEFARLDEMIAAFETAAVAKKR
jgi:hypothetical protein